MRHIPPAVTAALVVAGCAALDPQVVAGCHGVRRPANPQGSVLAPGAAAPPVSMAPGPSTACAGLRP